MNIFTLAFLTYAGERAGKTVIQAALGALVANQAGLVLVDWKAILWLALLAGAGSVLTSINGFGPAAVALPAPVAPAVADLSPIVLPTYVAPVVADVVAPIISPAYLTAFGAGVTPVVAPVASNTVPDAFSALITPAPVPVGA